MARVKLETGRTRLGSGSADDGGGGSYFTPTTSVRLFPSGCKLLDCVLAGGRKEGGYALGRIINIVGDKSTGKTLLAIEAAACFNRKFDNGSVRYNEVEAAFDVGYAEALGLPKKRISFASGCFTVNDVFKDMEATIKSIKGPCLYILDSLDAVSDAAELDGDLDKASYNMGKPKQMGQLFRRLVQKIENSEMTVIIISQLRDKIGVSFGEKHTRSGGRALDFYASQIIWLANMGQVQKTIKGIKRTVGVNVKVKNKKNKVGPPFREAEFPIMFGYGIDDVRASIEWLVEVKREAVLGKTAKAYYAWINGLSDDDYNQARHDLSSKVGKVWREIEQTFAPTRKKY